MQFTDYEDQALRTIGVHATRALEIANGAMGLAGEAGEVCDYLKKVLFHRVIFDSRILKDELGDVLWYLNAVAYTHGLTLTEIAEANIEKLQKRYPEGFKAGGGCR